MIKIFNLILILILIFNFNFNFKIVKGEDVCGPVQIEKIRSCGATPSSIRIDSYYVNISTIEISPLVLPINIGSSIVYNLVDGITYYISYINSGCTQVNEDSYTPNGMYYQLQKQPKCSLSAITLNLFNFNDVAFQTKTVQQGIINYQDNSGCSINAVVMAQNSSSYPSSNDIQVSHSMCGFSNGTIKINTSIYTKYFLSYNGVQVSETSNGYYSGLVEGQYILSVESTACEFEIIPIEIKKVYSQIAFDLIKFSNYIENSTMSFSLPSKDINSTIASIFISDENNIIPPSEWLNHKDRFSIDTFIYGYKYNYDFSPISVQQSSNICQQKESILTNNLRANVDYSISRPSSCKDNVTITFTPNYSNDVLSVVSPSNTGYSIINNKLSMPYNSDVQVFSYKSNSKLYFNTQFVDIKYKMVQINNESDCWKLYNITVLNYKIFSTLRIEAHNHGHSYILTPINGVFSNVADNRFKLVYKTSDCDTESYIYLSSQKPSPLDSVSINYQVKKNSSCTQDATVGFVLTTPIGTYSGEFVTSYSYNDNFLVPNSYCYYTHTYQLPTNINQDLQVEANDCTGKILTINSPYNLLSLTANGQDITSSKTVDQDGETQIIAHFRNGNYQCYSSKTINITQVSSGADIQVVNINDCSNPEGLVNVKNLFDYDSVYVVINGVDVQMNEGGLNVPMGEYLLKITKSSCLFTQKVIVGSNLVPKITTSTIREPTCSDSGFGDGLISVSVSTDEDGELKYFDILDDYGNVYNNRIFPAGVTGINNFKIKYNNCLWFANHSLSSTIEDPLIGLDLYHNSTDCTIKTMYKVVSNNSNVNIHMVDNLQYANLVLYDKLKYYITNINDNPEFVTYDVSWNNYCKKNFKTNISRKTVNNNGYLLYELVKPKDCSSNTMDVIVKNMNLFVSGSVLLSNKQPTFINSTHSIFKNLVATEGFLQISYKLLNGCAGFSGFYNPLGLVEDSISLNITNEVCYSNNGKVKINNFDSTNYYYKIISFSGVDNSEVDYTVDSNGQVSGLSSSSSYKVLKVSKNYGNCKTLQSFTISQDEPKIDSVIVDDSNSIQVLLNFVPTLVAYDIVVIDGDVSIQNSFVGNKIENVTAGTYQIKVTVKDSLCPVTLLSDNIIISNQDSSYVSSSNITKFSILFTVLSILIIIF